MFDDQNRDLILVALGEASPERTRQLREQARTDDELAAKLDLMQQLQPDAPQLIVRAVPPRRRLPLRRLVIAASLFLAVAGTAWATYALLSRPLFEDDFRSQWFHSEKWQSDRPGVQQGDGFLCLKNRGCIHTQQEFTGPIAISFEWRWIDHAEDPLYAEDLAVGLRTTGRHHGERPFELMDGVVVILNTWGGSVTVYESGARGPVSLPAGTLPMPAGAWHKVRITDDGETIRVYVAGPEISRNTNGEPAMQVSIKDTSATHHVALYNREMVAGATHESHIRKFRIERLK